MAKKLDGIREHDGWKHLKETFLVQNRSFMKVLVKRQMAGEIVDQREIDYMRGFYRGALTAIERPERAAVDLEREAHRIWRKGLIEALAKEDNPEYE